MRLTVKQLDLKMEDNLNFMSARLQRTERNYDEMLDRMDRSVVNFGVFRQETKSEFAEVRWRLDTIDKRLDAMQEQIDERFDAVDKRFDGMQEHIDKRFDEFQTTMTEFMHVISNSHTKLEGRVSKLEERIGVSSDLTDGE